MKDLLMLRMIESKQLFSVCKQSLQRLFAAWVLPLAIAALLIGCSSSGRVVWHSFEFDVRGAKPAVEVLDYRYGSSGLPGARASELMTKEGKTAVVGGGVGGQMTVAKDLYVKWRIKDSGQVFEETVDLRDRLPRNMEEKTVRFYIVGPQLYVYVVNPGFLPVGAPEEVHPEAPIKNLPYVFHHSYQIIYPDQPKQ